MKTRIITIASILVICLLLSVLCYAELGSFNFIRTGLALSKTMGQAGVYQIADYPEKVFLAGTVDGLESFRAYLETEGYTLRMDEQMGAQIPVEKDGVWDYVYWSSNAMYHKFRWETRGDPARVPADGGVASVTLYTPEMVTGSVYFYPTEDMELTAKTNSELTFRYPAAESFHSAEHRRLYWEGKTEIALPMDEGFCVPAADTAAFLDDALQKLGLTAREREDLLIHCLPRMTGDYILISFHDCSELTVSPTPDTLIRVFMTWKSLDEPVEIAPQTLTAPERTGFTVVEWGGGKIQ